VRGGNAEEGLEGGVGVREAQAVPEDGWLGDVGEGEGDVLLCEEG
jgi:hypothetical protein